jgi:hypothetical protein
VPAGPFYILFHLHDDDPVPRRCGVGFFFAKSRCGVVAELMELISADFAAAVEKVDVLVASVFNSVRLFLPTHGGLSWDRQDVLVCCQWRATRVRALFAAGSAGVAGDATRTVTRFWQWRLVGVGEVELVGAGS